VVCRHFILHRLILISVGIFPPILPGLTASATAVSPPKGAFGFTDSSGSNILAWTYPGVNDTTYRSGSDTRKRSYYISRDHGAHQIACRFILSPERQWVNWVEVWVDQGQMSSETQWHIGATIGVGLCADSSGFPGELLVDPVQYHPGQVGIPPSGGYLRVALDYPAPFSPPDTLWVLLEWPADYPDLVLVGTDDQPASFNAMYHVAGQEEPRWNAWVFHDFMIRLYTSRYDLDCTLPTESIKQENSRLARPLGPAEFIIARAERLEELPARRDSLFLVVPGEQICIFDDAVFAGCTYDYAIRAVEGADTSAAAIVSLDVNSPFSCNWDTPQAPVFPADGNISLPHTLHNSGRTQLEVFFLAGWMKPGLPGLSAMSWRHNGDSIPLYATQESTVVEPAGNVEFDLSPGDFNLGEGTYTMSSFFLIGDPAGRQIKYAFATVVQFSDPLGVVTDGGHGLPQAPSLSIFPNPTSGEFAIEFALPPGGGEESLNAGSASGTFVTGYSIRIYNVLGHEVARIDPVVTGQSADHFRVLFNGYDKSGNQLPSALYFIRVGGKGWSVCRKLIVLH